MYRTILVGFDGREGSRDALALARGLAAIEGAGLVLLAALDLDPLATPADAYARAMAEAEERLSAAARGVLGETPFRIRTIGGVGAPRALHEVAEDERADVIVLGSTHREGLGRVLPGSVGERLLHGAPCAVLVAPSGFAGRDTFEIRAIGVGYDGRTEAGHAREVAAALAADLGATVETITIGEHDGDPAEVLVERSRGLDLLVVGSRGYGPVRHALLGNVSWGVMRGSACPVLVVPRTAG
ncbi:MAG TPA: universal stress protein [Solirubrobacterales bacterium]|nr:universal stress protein [Solirubrobacterales bacterium]